MPAQRVIQPKREVKGHGVHAPKKNRTPKHKCTQTRVSLGMIGDEGTFCERDKITRTWSARETSGRQHALITSGTLFIGTN
eukprot:scaffold153556_cov45-Attheya_sp.AAC.4